MKRYEGPTEGTIYHIFATSAHADSLIVWDDSTVFYHVQHAFIADSLDTFLLFSTTDIEDTWIDFGNDETNYGSDTNLIVGDVGGVERSILIHIPYLADSVGAYAAGWEIKEARLGLYVSNWPDLGTVAGEAHYQVKPFEEDKATYDQWRYEAILPLRKEWGAAGANDTGSTWNESDGSGDDRGGTSQGSVSIPSAGWKYITLDTAWINNVVTLDSTLKYVIIDDGTAYAEIHSSEYTTDASLTPRFRVIMEKPGVAEGTDNDYGADTIVNLGKDTDDGDNWTARTFLGWWGADSWLDGVRVDSIVCSSFVTDFETAAYYLVHRADSTKSNAESEGFGSAADSCETTWPLYQKGGGVCTNDSVWTDSGGDYYETAIDSFYFDGTGWNVNSFTSYVLAPDNFDDTGCWKCVDDGGCQSHTPWYSTTDDVKLNLPANATNVRKMIVVLKMGTVASVAWQPGYLRFHISNNITYDSTDLDRSVGGTRPGNACVGVARPYLHMWATDTTASETDTVWFTRRFIFDADLLEDDYKGMADTTDPSDWYMYMNSVGQKSVKIDLWDAESDDFIITVDSVIYTVDNGIVDHLQAIADGNSVVDHELRGEEEFLAQVGNLILVNDTDDEEIEMASEDNTSSASGVTMKPKFWVYYSPIPLPDSLFYTAHEEGWYRRVEEGLGQPASGP
jgi:hypothetical protein